MLRWIEGGRSFARPAQSPQRSRIRDLRSRSVRRSSPEGDARASLRAFSVSPRTSARPMNWPSQSPQRAKALVIEVVGHAEAPQRGQIRDLPQVPDRDLEMVPVEARAGDRIPRAAEELHPEGGALQLPLGAAPDGEHLLGARVAVLEAPERDLGPGKVPVLGQGADRFEGPDVPFHQAVERERPGLRELVAVELGDGEILGPLLDLHG